MRDGPAAGQTQRGREGGRQTMLVGMRTKKPQGTIVPLDFLGRLDRIRVLNPTTARSSQKQCESWRAVTVSRFFVKSVSQPIRHLQQELEP